MSTVTFGQATIFTHPNTNVGKTTVNGDYLAGYDDEDADPNSVPANWQVSKTKITTAGYMRCGGTDSNGARIDGEMDCNELTAHKFLEVNGDGGPVQHSGAQAVLRGQVVIKDHATDTNKPAELLVLGRIGLDGGYGTAGDVLTSGGSGATTWTCSCG